MIFGANKGYLEATRHPWPCLLFLMPLLIFYECGVLWLGDQAIRNGADDYLRLLLYSFGLDYPYLPPVLLSGILMAWSVVRRKDQPPDAFGVTAGMVIESVAFALGLWAICRNLSPFLGELGISVNTTGTGTPTPSTTLQHALGQVVQYVGAGIYEEMLFRLILFSLLEWVLLWINLQSPWSAILAGVGSSLLFSAAHHIGPYGEEFHGFNFLFRTVAGLYFATLYRVRGFGIAAGSHACYDVLVGPIVA